MPPAANQYARIDSANFGTRKRERRGGAKPSLRRMRGRSANSSGMLAGGWCNERARPPSFSQIGCFSRVFVECAISGKIPPETKRPISERDVVFCSTTCGALPTLKTVSQLARSLGLPVSVVSFWMASHAATAWADPSLLQPSVLLRAPLRVPPGVPADYVLTRAGFLHPSCVITVRSGETVGDDRVIRGTDGRERTQIAPCSFPRYDRAGVMIAAASQLRSVPHAVEPAAPPSHAPPSPQYDGWILSYDFDGDLNPGNTLKVSTDVVVPLAPLHVDGQDVGTGTLQNKTGRRKPATPWRQAANIRADAESSAPAAESRSPDCLSNAPCDPA